MSIFSEWSKKQIEVHIVNNDGQILSTVSPPQNNNLLPDSPTSPPHPHTQDTCLIMPIVPNKYKILTVCQYLTVLILLENASDSLYLPKMQPEFCLIPVDLFLSTITFMFLKMPDHCWDLNKIVYFICKPTYNLLNRIDIQRE